MPVTATLSKAFYDRLGENIANELVEWFNLVDATYRSDLRELNELNFARFDARVEQRIATLEARLNARIDTLSAKLEARLDAKLDASVAEHAFAELGSRIKESEAALSTKLEHGLKVQVMWLLGAWGLFFATIVGLWLRR